jgi:phage-related protein
LWGALQPLLPVFAAIGGLILGVVVVAIGVFVGVLGGLLKALSGLLQGVATVIGGMVQFFTGGVQIISGLIKFFVDLATGNFKNLGNDLHSIWNGIVNMFFGMWNVIKGIFQGAWNAISGFVSGLVQGVIGFFQHLAATLVGHSIIPDMINAIVGWFLSLPGKALNAIGSLAGSMVSFFGGLARQALTWGLNIISNLAGGIINGIWSSLGNAMSAIGNFISSHLPHSPAKVGPLRDLALQGSRIPEQIAQGIMSGIPKLTPSLNLMLTPHASFTPSRAAGAGASSSSGSQQPIILQLDSYQVGRILMPAIVANIRNNLGVNNL